MKFTSPELVQNAIHWLDEVECRRSLNRSKVNEVANGFPPMSAAEASKWGLRIVVDWNETAQIFSQATGQYRQAFWGPRQFFTLQWDKCPEEKRVEWESWSSKFINTKMVRSKKYYHVWDNKATSVVMHGPGLVMWNDQSSWCEDFVAIEDFRTPTDVNASFDNMPWCAIRRNYTPGELEAKINGKFSDKRWKRKTVLKMLKAIKDDSFRKTFNDDEWQSPEKFLERIKQNSGYYTSDDAPSIPMWDFYFQNDDQKILRRVVAATDTPGEVSQEWIYDGGDTPIADDWSQVIHMLPGNLSNKPPKKYYSQRSLGLVLVDPCFWLNVTRCFRLQHTIMSFKPWVRNSDPIDRAKQLFMDIGNCCVIPEGVSIVPWEQRHRIDNNLANAVLADLSGIIQKRSTSYTQELNDGTSKEKTAYESRALVEMVNAGLTQILSDAKDVQVWGYRENCRRFCRPGTTDPDCKAFQEKAKEMGIPKELLTVENWNVVPVTTMGQGNKTLEMDRANMLMQASTQYPPESQNEILYKWTNAIIDNPDEAARLTKRGQQKEVTKATHDAQESFGSLMQGVKVDPLPGLSPIESATALIGQMQQFLQSVPAVGAATMREILGLNAVAAHVGAQIQQIAKDPRQKQAVKGLGDELGQIMNNVKKLQQQTMEKMKAEGAGQEEVDLLSIYDKAPEDIKRQLEARWNLQPSRMPVTDPKMLKAQQQLQINSAKAMQKMKQAEQDHQQAMRQGAEAAAMKTAAKNLEMAQQAYQASLEAEMEARRTEAPPAEQA